MNKKIFYFMIMLIFSCEQNKYNPIYNGDEPFRDEEIKTFLLSENNGIRILDKRTFWGSINYYALIDGHENFLLNRDYLDEGEELNDFQWYSYNNQLYCLFFYSKSIRFNNNTRLALYSFSDNKVSELLDQKKLTILNYYFHNNIFYYKDLAINEHTVVLK